MKTGWMMVLALVLIGSQMTSNVPIWVAARPISLPDMDHPLVYRPASFTVPGAPPYVPSDIQKAYDFLPIYASGIEGNGTRIAIVDAFGDPSLSTDLASFDSLTGLSSPTLNT